MLSALQSKLEPLVPEHTLRSSEENLRRARTVLWLAAGFGPLYLLAILISLLIRGPNPLAGALIVGGAALLLTPLLLHLRESSIWAAGWFLGANLLTVSAVTWLGYGPTSPAAHTFILFPVVAFILGGQRLGLPFLGVVLLQLGALVGAHYAGHTFPLSSSGDRYVLINGLAIAGVIAVTTLFLASYDAAWREASAQSERDRAMLKTANEKKSAFLANMSHEFRTPLNAIIGYTELLRETACDEDLQDLNRVHTSGRHLVNLVDKLLDLSKIEAGKMSIKVESINLSAVTAAAADEIHPFAEKYGVTLVTEIDTDMRTQADGMFVRQILLNLLSNACKFTRDGEVRLRAFYNGGKAVIEVIDDGVGMAPEELARCFDPFEQGEAGTNHGTGLGLAISFNLAQAMGGSLSAQSTQGSGSCFRLEL